MIIAVLLDIFLFLSYSVIYSYVSFLMRLIEIIKTLILLFSEVCFIFMALLRCYNQTSGGLHTATLAATSSSGV